MIRLSINLPFKKRLHLHVVERRGTSTDPIFPDLEEIKRARKGSKFSRYFTHIFRHKNIRNIFGVNLAAIVAASTLMPAGTGTIGIQAEDNIIREEISILTTQNSVQYPVEEVKITQGYKFYHPGIDLDGVTGDAIYPILAGHVEDVNYSKYAYGNAVIVNHGSGLTSLYAHLSKIFVEKGELVSEESQIGQMGATGRANGDHLHLEVRDNGIAINPLSILPR